MNAIALLLALLVVAYIGSSLSLARGVRDYSLPSGVEYVLLGTALGPSALGLVDRATLASMAPIFVFALGWIAMEQGVECCFVETRRVSLPRAIAGCVLGGLLATAIASAVFVALTRFGIFQADQRLVASVGVALVSCESTRHALRWVAEHHDAEGPLSRLISDISSADVTVPLVALAWWFSVAGEQPSLVLQRLAPSVLTLITLALGVVLGVLVIALLRTSERSVDAWGVLLGGALIGVGVAHGSHVSWMTTLFAMGMTLSLFRDQRDRISAKLAKTEHPVLLPILALAGAHIDIRSIEHFVWVLPVAFIARSAFTVIVSGVARRVSPIAALGGPWLGPSLMSSGALTVCIGFACALHLPGSVGQLILVAAVIDTIAGEVVGPIALRRALGHAGEINTRPSTPETPSTPTSTPTSTPANGVQS